MSGLFLNFFTVEIPFKTVDIEYLKYSDYSTKESLRSLRKEYSDFTFYRNGDKILLWPKIGGTSTKFNHYPIFNTQINLKDNAKVLSKILEESIIGFSAQKGYKVFPNKYSGAWEIISPKNLLTN